MRKQLLTCKLYLVIMGSLAGCADSYSVDSNISKQRWDNYFSVGKVELYDAAQLSDHTYNRLGLIGGESCQQNASQPPPDVAQARTMARRETVEAGGNAILGLRCVQDSTPLPGCLASISCFGEAITLSDSSGN